MRGLNKEGFLRVVNGDIERIKMEAVYVVRLLSKFEVDIIKNPNGRLNVIAIIGQGSFYFDSQLLFFDEVALCEIGIGKTRPYSEAKKPINSLSENEERSIAKRKKYFNLTLDQYELVAPYLFFLIQQITNEKVARRVCNHKNPYYISSQKHYYSYRQGKDFYFDTFKPKTGSSGFVVSIKDKFLASDVYFAEMFLNKDIAKYLSGLARFIDKRLKPYRFKKINSNCLKLKGFVKVREIIEKHFLPKYLIIELLNNLPKGKRNYFYNEMVEIVGWDGKETFEKQMANNVVENPFKRLDGIQLHLTYKHQNKDLIVFQVNSNLGDIDILKDVPF